MRNSEHLVTVEQHNKVMTDGSALLAVAVEYHISFRIAGKLMRLAAKHRTLNPLGINRKRQGY